MSVRQRIRVDRLLPLCGAFAGMAAFTWRRSGDPIIDWGRELLVAWYVSQGWGVPVDSALLFGPLSPHFNGLLFRIFGTSITTLLVANLLVLAVASACVWLIARRLFGRSTAALALIAFLALSGFPHLTLDGNYSFITPYAHGITHGATLGLMMITVLIAGRARRLATTRWLLAGGLCGLTLFTKPEVGVAVAGTMIVALLLPENDDGARAGPLVWAALGLLVAVCGASLALLAGEAGSEALGMILAPYRTAGLPAARGNGLYRLSLGLDAPVAHLAAGIGTLTALSAALALLVGVRARLARVQAATSGLTRAIMLGAALGAAILVSLVLRPLAWLWIGRALPFGVLLLIGGSLPVIMCGPDRGSGRYARARARTILGVFALLLLLKLGIRARFDHYGFALAAPAVLLCVGGLSRSLPVVLRHRFGRVPGARALGRGLVMYVIGMSAATSLILYQARDFAVGAGGDRMYILSPLRDPRSATFAETLGYLEQRTESSGTLQVVPEGALLNFLLRARPPADFASLMPLEVEVLGPERLADRLRDTAPRVVVLMAEPMGSYGLASFPPGDAIYAPLMEWIEGSYCVEQTFSASVPGRRHEVTVLSACPRETETSRESP